jgi:hypothetical protein
MFRKKPDGRQNGKPRALGIHVIGKGSGICLLDITDSERGVARPTNPSELIIRRDPRFCGGELCHQPDRNGPLTA